MITAALNQLIDGGHLSRTQMAALMNAIADGAATAAQTGALLTALRLRGESVEELTGAAEVMRARVERIRVAHPIFVDTCGTGGDGAGTFNISTAAALVAAGAGLVVAKHGNRSVSSRCGSADVLAELGVNVTASRAVVEHCVAEVGIGFLFAPQHHPAFKQVAAIRKELGVRTLFNLLGPLANPAGARRQVIGVFAPEWVDRIACVLLQLGAEHALVVHGNGLDELSISGPTLAAEVRDGAVRGFTLTPEELGLTRHPREALAGGSAAENAQVIRQVLDGQLGAPREAVVGNAAAALYVGARAATLREGVVQARAAIDGGQARARLQRLVEESNR
jgi:anthranilate phosphoribosyltransferase